VQLSKTDKKLFVLDNTETEQMFFKDALVIGIVAPINDYKFCWFINTNTALDFRKTQEQSLHLRKQKAESAYREYVFSVYECEDPLHTHQHILYTNKCDGEFLLPELKNFDFIWLIQGVDIQHYNGNDVIELLKSLSVVQVCTIINAKLITHKSHLII
jgi:hypothetical protein